MISASARSQATRYRHRAVFKRTTKRRLPSMADETVDEEIPISQDRFASSAYHAPIMIQDYFTNPPLVRDQYETETSDVQNDTVDLCLPCLYDPKHATDPKYNEFGVPRLDRDRHIAFLAKNLGPLPGMFLGYDASRPWLLFWCLNGLSLLGADVEAYRQPLIDTARSMQNASGGFGGGHGQASHLATTYAVVMSLAIVGGEDCYDVVDRRALWKWLNSLKQPDGGFTMSVGGEEDVRGAYCAAVVISILGLPLDLSPESPAWSPEMPTLFSGLANYVQRCQTYEGGISAQPGTEAHGGYAFCALGCLSILDSPDRSIPRYLNVPRLISWLASRQYAPEGGFSGRTNKLVDGCYSHWVGDCWPLVEACLERSAPASSTDGQASAAKPVQSLFSREGLVRYILCCCQDQTKRGGLRDKPGRTSDAYHTCYVLSGLSSAQHKWELVDRPAASDAEGVPIYSEPVWKASPFPFGGQEGVQMFEEEDRVATVHPVYTIPAERVEQIKDYFRAKTGF